MSWQVWWEKEGVEGVSENGKHLVDVSAERGLFLVNTFFQHKMIHQYTWRRKEDGGEEKSLIDYNMDKLKACGLSKGVSLGIARAICEQSIER